VRAITLDAFNFPRLDLIKMDVEGIAGSAGERRLQHSSPPPDDADRGNEGRRRKAARLAGGARHTLLQSGIRLLAFRREDEGLKHIAVEQPAYA
jgi:hypothetical protein